MPNTFSQISVQVVFAVQGRQNLIPSSHKEEVYKYIGGIVRKQKQKLLAIGGMPDHVHIFLGLEPDTALSDLVRDIKNNSSRFINTKQWFPGKFNWQSGYGAFSYSRSQRDDVIRYIQNQERHHARRTFQEEYIKFLQAFEINYDAKYLFDWIE
ncbi:MAG TPA: IS200/IS605 family transposase [Candidatus Kapabacteria bacterium]|nr:IS200/IS605 family transposase [Candidatus Kapabacteria bacterium]